MEALADAVGLRALGLGTCVIDTLDREVALVNSFIISKASLRLSTEV